MSNPVKKTKLTELRNKIPDISKLATKTSLTAVENKIPRISITQKLLKLKINFTPEFNSLTPDVLMRD